MQKHSTKRNSGNSGGGGGQRPRKGRSCSRSRRRSRSRSRVRSRSPRRDRNTGGSGSGRGSNRSRKPRGGGGNKGNNSSHDSSNRKDDDKKDDPAKDSNKSKDPSFSSPSSLVEAWDSSFFTAPALLLLTSLGLVVSWIPSLDKLPLGGRLRHCIQTWKKVTNNKWVLNVVSEGYKIPFKFIPSQRWWPRNQKVKGLAFEVLAQEATDLLAKESVAPVAPVKGQFVSSYFAVAKARSPGKFRPILNLKGFNKFVKKYKFRMEGLKQVRDWVQKDAWFCGMDLRDAFLHIPIHESFRKFLRFQWLESLFEWQVLPFGLKCSPRVLTKVLKPVVAFLRVTWGS